jgi:hypothetical protein
MFSVLFDTWIKARASFTDAFGREACLISGNAHRFHDAAGIDSLSRPDDAFARQGSNVTFELCSLATVAEGRLARGLL